LSDEPDLLAVGERVALGPLRADLAADYARWVNQTHVKRGTGALGLMTPEAERDWVQERVKEGAARRPSVAGFTVYDRSDLAPVGTTALMGIDHRDRTAEFGISMGDRRGQGLGTDAARLTLDWGFTVLSLHNVLLRALDWNVPALASYRRAGFRELGRRREAVLSDGRLCDEVYMDALASEFTGSVLAPGAGG
jgi:diamine N-acetyltransferase